MNSIQAILEAEKHPKAEFTATVSLSKEGDAIMSKRVTVKYNIGGKLGQITGRILRERSDSISILPKGRPAWATEIIFKRYITEIV